MTLAASLHKINLVQNILGIPLAMHPSSANLRESRLVSPHLHLKFSPRYSLFSHLCVHNGSTIHWTFASIAKFSRLRNTYYESGDLSRLRRQMLPPPSFSKSPYSMLLCQRNTVKSKIIWQPQRGVWVDIYRPTMDSEEHMLTSADTML